MDRREFMKLGGLGSLAYSSTSRDALARGPLSHQGMQDLARGLDTSLEGFRERFSKAREGLSRGTESAALDEPLMGLMESLFVYNTFSELPLKAQAHPEMQDRIRWAARRYAWASPRLLDALDDDEALPYAMIDELMDVDREGLFELLDDADRRVENRGGSLSGRRKLNRLMHSAALDIQARGSRATFADYTERARPIVDNPPPPPPVDSKTALAVARAQREWIAAGVSPLEFDRLANGAENPVMYGFGIGLMVIGGIIFVVGLVTVDPECICISLLLWLIGAGLFVIGLALFVNSEPGKLQREGARLRRSGQALTETP